MSTNFRVLLFAFPTEVKFTPPPRYEFCDLNSIKGVGSEVRKGW